MSESGQSRVELAHRELGSTGLSVTEVCIGTSPIANMAGLYGYEVGEERAIETVLAVFDSPFNFLDTSNGYGANGESEVRIGKAIARVGGLPDGFVLATKVDPDPATRDYSGARVRRSIEESLERLGLERFDLLQLHDPEQISFEEGTAAGGPLEALVALKEEGLVDNIGVAGGPVGLLQQYIDTGVFDVVLSHNRLTLLDRSAESLFASARERGMGVMNAAPYGGGMLAKGPEAQPKYAYGARDDRITEAAIAMRDACGRFGVPLAAAALQFSTRHPLVHSTVVGVSAPERVQQTLDYLAVAIPDELWAELADLTPSKDLWLD
ncbi:aldo/keto reductase [Amnibacterium flavum]|uniref:Oxidoreductase n=1 Tax=Amnibacterium flavum TaxID=2173173 RepID=A0A2V1HX05_9MICO|nr:aldo/keto reductase [Amnibacterium flavum]PVZ95760.1 oxidoreductase [Amnibacterium flavum]